LIEKGAADGAKLVVLPELAFTTFFPRYEIDDEAELESYFEATMPNNNTQKLFDAAKKLKVGFYVGYAELAEEDGAKKRYNTAILVDDSGEIVGKYRKIHLPGTDTPVPEYARQQLEKRYFEIGNLGFPVIEAFGAKIGMAICNDRRWPETFRVLALKGAEVVVIGYNSVAVNRHTGADEHDLYTYHSNLTVQAGAYQNANWVVSVAKAGIEDGSPMVGSSVIVDPNGEFAAQTKTLGDEVVTHTIDLDAAEESRRLMFNFEKNRRIEEYGIITAQRGPTE
ncbi:MAG TPA: N-carbamoyl-D-amino-acid hydrolase, partial [Rhodospirillaceae bacterium]|nr:N-carbamoyl-D-amino-acid hydrolase [Rhodospirillaceae bacterium]